MRAALLVILLAVGVGVGAALLKKGGEDHANAAESNQPTKRPTKVADSTAGEARVLVRDVVGKAVAGFRIELQGVSGKAVAEPVDTDRDGTASFEDLPKARLKVYSPELDTVLGDVDVSRQRRTIKVSIPAVRSVQVAARVDGVPSLPASFEVTTTNARILERKDDAEAGTSTIKLRAFEADRNATLELSGCGCQKQDVEVPSAARSMTYRIPVRFTTHHELAITVSPPGDGVYQLELHRLVEGLERWRFVDTTGEKSAAKGTHRIHYRDLRRGTYRVVDVRSGLATPRIMLGDCEVPIGTHIDLSSVVAVFGYVRGPEKANLGEARVHVEGVVPSLHPMSRAGVPVLSSGPFEVRARNGMPATIRVTHPVLAPAGEKGIARIQVGKSEQVELHLESARRLRFRMDPNPLDPRQPRQQQRVRIHIYDNIAVGKPVFIGDARPEKDGWWEIGGLPAGRRTWVVYAPGFSPLHVPGVLVQEKEASELPYSFNLKRNGRVDVRLVVPAGSRAPAVTLRATHLKLPFLVREEDNRQRRDLSMRGLAAGTWWIEILDSEGQAIGPGQKFEIEKGSTEAVNVAWDLR